MSKLHYAYSAKENYAKQKQAYVGDRIANVLPDGRVWLQVVAVPYDGSTRQQRRALNRQVTKKGNQ